MPQPRLVVGLVVLCLARASAQLPIPGLPGVDLPEVGGLLGGLKTLTDGQEPITTTIEDAQPPCTFLNLFTPPERILRTEPRLNAAGEWVWGPGYYRLELCSFCMKPGAGRPTEGGDGYLRAPLKGPRAAVIKAILQRSAPQADITQESVQVLLWAIIARTRFEDMPPECRQLAQRLLGPAEMAELRGAALPVVGDDVLERLVGKLPPFAQDLLRRQNQIRGLLAGGAVDYGALEAAAMGEPEGGESPLPPGTLLARAGCWNYHPAGAFYRYDVLAYHTTQLWLAVPREVTVTRDRQGRIVALDDGFGRRIETTYKPRGLRFRSDPGLRACAFATVTCTQRDPARPERVRRHVIRDRGWTFIGYPGPAQRARASDTGAALRFAQDDGGDDGVDVDEIIDAIGEELVGDEWESINERYEKAKEVNESIEEWRDNVRKVTDGPTADDIKDLTDTDHYKDGLDAVLEQDIEAQGDWLGDHVKLGVDAYIYAGNAVAEAGMETKPEKPAKPFNPASITMSIQQDMAVPQRPANQRVSLWERVFGK